MSTTSRTGIAYPSGEPECTLIFSGVRVASSLVICSVSQIIVCAFLLFPFTIVLSALRFTDFDYPFGIFKLFLGNVRLCASQLKDNWQQHQINNIVRGGSMWPPVARQTTFSYDKKKHSHNTQSQRHNLGYNKMKIRKKTTTLSEEVQNPI